LPSSTDALADALAEPDGEQRGATLCSELLNGLGENIVVDHDNSLGLIKRDLVNHAASCGAQAGLT
jgi:hypothetical protein